MSFAALITATQAVVCDIGFGWQVWLPWWLERIAC
jgi:hypothetical protein